MKNCIVAEIPSSIRVCPSCLQCSYQSFMMKVASLSGKMVHRLHFNRISTLGPNSRETSMMLRKVVSNSNLAIEICLECLKCHLTYITSPRSWQWVQESQQNRVYWVHSNVLTNFRMFGSLISSLHMVSSNHLIQINEATFYLHVKIAASRYLSRLHNHNHNNKITRKTWSGLTSQLHEARWGEALPLVYLQTLNSQISNQCRVVLLHLNSYKVLTGRDR